MTRNSSTQNRNSASKNTTRKTTNNKKSTTQRSNSGRQTSAPRQRTEQERMISSELTLLLLLAVTILLFLCNFGIIGPVGNAISGFLFGIFGILAYIAPIFIFVAVAFGISNKDNFIAILKLIAAITLFIVVGSFMHIFQANLTMGNGYSISEIYNLGKNDHMGGGVLCGSIAYLLFSLLDKIGSILILLVLSVCCVVIITEKSLINGVKKGSRYVVSTAKDDAKYRREKALLRKEELRQERLERQKQVETTKK